MATAGWRAYDTLKFSSCSASNSEFLLPPQETKVHATTDTNNKVNGRVILNGTKTLSYGTTHSYGYEQKLERECHWSPVSGAKQMVAQPQLHLGMFAVPALNPSLSTETFTNACMYYSVEASIDMCYDFDSMYAKGDMEYWPAQPEFYNGQKMYTTGTCMFGMDFTNSGDVTETVPASSIRHLMSSREDQDYVKKDQIRSVLDRPIYHRGVYKFANACI